jgi:hypothetical protein
MRVQVEKRLRDMTPNWILLDVRALPRKTKVQQASNFNKNCYK